MSTITNVILITGFLGSGKTTFLNRMIKTFPKNQKLMILMNEFGEIGLDGTLVEGEELDLLEISKGSIFCACVKTDFIRALNEIAQDLKPDVLVIEPTGVANPSDLKKYLELSIFKNRFQMRDQICIIDADCFQDTYGAYVSVEKQIASSDLFVINKVDLASEETISAIKDIVGTYHPSPEFYETTFAEIPMDRFIINRQENDIDQAGIDNPTTPAEIDRAIEDLLENPGANSMPPDRLLSAVFSWKGNSIESFKSMIPLFPKRLIRAKGILIQESDTYLFNLVMAQHTVEVYSSEKDCTPLINNIVFIGPPDVIEELKTLSREYPDFTQKSVCDPMQTT